MCLCLSVPLVGMAQSKAVNPPDPVAVTMEPLMLAEFALSKGDLASAAEHYLKAAQRSGDGVVAERAFDIALVNGNDRIARSALTIWEGAKTRPDALLAAQFAMALREKRNANAVAHLTTLFGRNDLRLSKLGLATLATAAIDEAQARSVLRSVIESGAVPRQLDVWMAIGGMAQSLDDDNLTDVAIAQMVRQFPDEPRVALIRATKERMAGREASARTILKSIESHATSDEILRSSISLEYRIMGDYPDAARVLAMGPQSAESYAERAYALAQSDNLQALNALYVELQSTASKPDPAQRLLLGQIAEHLKKYEDALRWYNSVPGDEYRTTAQLAAAGVLFELKRASQGQDILHAIQSDQDVSDDTRRDAFLLESTLLQQAGDDNGEARVLDKALAAFPNNPSVLYQRALMYERRDQVDLSVAEFRKILTIDPNNVETLNALGYTLADRTTEYQEALQLINRARAAQPNNAAIIDSYGWVLFKMGKPKEALEQLQRAARLQRDPEIFAHLAEVMLALGDRAGALRVLEQAIKLDTDHSNRAVRNVRELLKEAP